MRTSLFGRPSHIAKNVEREKEIEKQKRELKQIFTIQRSIAGAGARNTVFSSPDRTVICHGGAKDRNEFCAIADISRKLKDTEIKLHHINAQLQGGHPEEIELADSNTLTELKNKQFVENERKERLTEEIQQLGSQIALLFVKQEQLEASGLVSDLKPQTEMQKSVSKKPLKMGLNTNDQTGDPKQIGAS